MVQETHPVIKLVFLNCSVMGCCVPQGATGKKISFNLLLAVQQSLLFYLLHQVGQSANIAF